MKVLIILGHIITLGIFHTPNLDKAYQKVHDAESLEYFFNYLYYSSDLSIKDEWRTPEESLKVRGIDCEDFAVLGYEALKRNGYECGIYTVHTENRHHAVLVYSKGEERGIFSNEYRFDKLTLEQLMRYEGYERSNRIDWRTRRKKGCHCFNRGWQSQRCHDHDTAFGSFPAL